MPISSLKWSGWMFSSEWFSYSKDLVDAMMMNLSLDLSLLRLFIDRLEQERDCVAGCCLLRTRRSLWACWLFTPTPLHTPCQTPLHPRHVSSVWCRLQWQSFGYWHWLPGTTESQDDSSHFRPVPSIRRSSVFPDHPAVQKQTDNRSKVSAIQISDSAGRD